MKKFIIITFAFLLPVLIYCQEEIRIFYYKGKIETSTDNKNWSNKDLLGLKLEKTMIVRVDQSAEVSFLNKSGKIYKISQKGSYTSVDIHKGFKSDQATFLAAYSEFVWEQLKSHHTKLEDYSKGNLKDQGYVSRGCPAKLMLYPPDNSAIIDSLIIFYWNTKDDSSYFNFTMLTQSQKYIIETIVPGIKYEYTIPSIVFRPGSRLSWYVTPSPGVNHCFENRLYVLPADTIVKINKLVGFYLENQRIDEQWKHYWAASVYSDYNIFNKAEAEFKTALKIEENPEIRETYRLFMKKYGF